MMQTYSNKPEQSGKSAVTVPGKGNARAFFKPASQRQIIIDRDQRSKEAEADMAAEQIIRNPFPGNYFFRSQTNVVQRKCSHCEEEQNLQMKGDRGGRNNLTAPAIVSDAINCSGEKLDTGTRNFMETRFGHDFRDVKIHNDSLAHRSSATINALAYTIDNNIVFGAGNYQPNTNTGKTLLAHELAHVVQQRKSTDVKKSINRKPAFNDVCDNYHRCLVIEAIPPAKKLIDHVIKTIQPVAKGTVKAGAIVDELNFHFKTGAVADAGDIIQNFRLIKAELDNTVKYNCFSEDPAECKSDEGHVGALTDCAAGDDIDLCLFYFNMKCLERARQLIHENAHHLGFCYDYAYAHQANYATITHAEAMKNPDTYAQFAKSVYPGSPACKDCSTEIQIKNKRY